VSIRTLVSQNCVWNSSNGQLKHSRRIDGRLLPILGLMYSVSLVDRTNLGLALVAGMEEDLGLGIGSRYNIIVMMFFIMDIYLWMCNKKAKAGKCLNEGMEGWMYTL
jgi:hypothetical protein